MAEKIDDRLKVEVEKYNEINNEKKKLEVELGKLNQAQQIFHALRALGFNFKKVPAAIGNQKKSDLITIDG